jgi:hypothetical protein
VESAIGGRCNPQTSLFGPSPKLANVVIPLVAGACLSRQSGRACNSPDSRWPVICSQSLLRLAEPDREVLGVVISEEAIRLAVETGNDKYWKDTRKQHEAYERWRANDFKGECEQLMRGSLIVYIIEEVMKAIKAER